MFKSKTISKGLVDDGFAVEPTNRAVYSPVDGKVTMIAKTKHAIGITTKNGTEILIHMGLDAVDLNGLPFDVKVKEDQEVKKGQLLVDMNIEMIKKNGKEPTVIVVLTQPDKILNNKTYNVANKNMPIGKIGNATN